LTIELFHIGEILIAEMLSRVSARRQLHQVSCAVTGINLASELGAASAEFFANQALVKVHSGKQTYSCDGAQKIDILCVGEERAIAIEAKLGETRMSRSAFLERFCGSCENAGHRDPRIKGNMIALLDRQFPFKSGQICASLGNRSLTIAEHWWLVVRESVWINWASISPLRSARILVFEQLARVSCRTACEFDDLVLQVVGNDFADRWRIRFD